MPTIYEVLRDAFRPYRLARQHRLAVVHEWAGIACYYDPSAVDSVVLCAGKVATEAKEWRDDEGAAAAIVRVEQLYPWPGERVADVVARYPNANEVVWLQEEPANMGAWSFVYGRMFADPMPLRAVTRPASGSPACGSLSVHHQEVEALRADLFNRG